MTLTSDQKRVCPFRQPTGHSFGVCFEDDDLPLTGLTVATVKELLSDAWRIPYFADAVVNGRPAPADHVLSAGDRLEFRRRTGVKGGHDRNDEEIEAESLVRAYPELFEIAARVKALDLPADRSLDVMVGSVVAWAEKRFGPPNNDIVAILKDVVARLDRIESGRLPLNQRESDMVEALGSGTMTGEELAARAGYEYDGHFKGVLASMRKRGIIGNKRPGGYFVPGDRKS